MSEKIQIKRIIITNTKRTGEDYLKSLEFRNNGNYDKLPNYVVMKNGELIKTLEVGRDTNFFDEDVYNKNSIIISLENLGWVNKNTLSTTYSNWLGVKINKVYEKKWRDKFFWDIYTDEQMNTLVDVCLNSCEQHKIPKKFIGHNTLIDGIEKFSGIITRSNFSSQDTDVSPSFNFAYLLENFDYE
jgi:N-acetyl-anhydromuramyl-L-alanine amidase AmpD